MSAPAFSLYTDGSAQPNPGPCGSGAVMLDPNGNIVWTLSEFLGDGTNNVGELFAILRGVSRAMEMGVTTLQVFSDSEMSVHLLTGEKQTKKEHLMYLVQRIQKLLLKKESMKVDFSWVKAHAGHKWNEMADRLANAALATTALSTTPTLTPTTTPMSPLHAPRTNTKNTTLSTNDDAPRILLRCSFAEKDDVKKLGARWDPSQKSWWVADTPEHHTKFAKWIQK